MTPKPFVIRRGAIRPFLIALAGVPLIALLYDFLTGSTVLTRFGELIYRDEIDAFEARDLIWAALFGIVGTAALAWGLRELLVPRKVMVIDGEGLLLAVAGPFKGSARVEWADIISLVVADLDLDGEVTPRLELALRRSDMLPQHPWAARWRDERTLSIDVSGWDHPREEILREFASRRLAATVQATDTLDG